MKSEDYQHILQHNVGPSVRKLDLPQRSWVFQQDNDPKHTSKSTRKWFERKHWRLLRWPAMSPDLNPIEHLWRDLKMAVWRRHPSNIRDLEQFAKEEWSKIPAEHCKKLTDGYQKRRAHISPYQMIPEVLCSFVTNNRFIEKFRNLGICVMFANDRAPPSMNPPRKTRRSRRHRTGSRQNDDQIAGTETPNIVYNISSYCLSPSEMNLLQKGLTFCPVSRFNSFLLDQELHQFFRTLRLKAHFLGLPSIPLVEASLQSSFALKDLNLRIPSSFQPPRTYHPVEIFIEDIKVVLESIENGNLRIKHNLSIEEFRSLQSLKARKELIIKPADKGGAIVVLDRTYYMDEIRSQLRDTNTYLPISSNPSFDKAREIKHLTSHYFQLGIIDQKLVEFLNNQHPVIPVFYTLPKVHKDLARPPGRPIVASTNSLLSPLAITMDKILSPLVPLTQSYLKDTTHFLKSLRDLGVLPKGCTLVTMDVNSLYTSIEHQKGMEAVKLFLMQHTNFSNDQLAFCRDLLSLILTKIFFLFEDQFFFQIKGTAMGSNVAPPYANIFMDYFEKSFVYPHFLFTAHILYWRRFIDDIFFVWTGTSEDLLLFHNDLNSSISGLSFTIHSDQHSVNILDTTITIMSNGTLESDLYVKTTDRNSLLLYTSSHRSHTKKALPKSQHDRINRIVSDPEIRFRCHREMDNKFKSRGYPNKILGSMNFGAQSEFRCPKLQRLAFVNTFHPFNSQINRCILKLWNVLQRAYPQVPEFLNKPIICHKRTQNLRNHLVRADVGPSRELKQQFLSTPRNGTFPCLSCLQCSNITKGDSFTHPRSGRRFPIQGHYTCDSTYVIYLIKCPCGLGYVGETTQHIRDRISQHKSTIRCGRTLLPIPAHFLECKHQVSQLRYQIIDHVPIMRRGGDRIKKLKEREWFWIYSLQTLSPLGLNREYEFSH
ncbi:unnamed protein product [Ranitomeya imitator]|uniref:Reverse transcriptase domain-containing protein n=1 Tax=Ranitomeya imitator TaxID=111125 RepID=A0ABN9L981_9NEOB|nr:unnamed protein product [Ranitomeya imitator]